MTRTSLGRVLAVLVAVGCSGAAFAQERGRTDGPEGSEYGKGGYSAPGGGRFSLVLNWGAAMASSEPLSGLPDGPPLFVGLTGSFWIDEWFIIDVSPSFLLDSSRVNVLIGPRFRASWYPLSFNLGLQAGPVFVPGSGTRFAISPNASIDSLFADHYILGLAYAPDITFGAATEHRVFLTAGYRF